MYFNDCRDEPKMRFTGKYIKWLYLLLTIYNNFSEVSREMVLSNYNTLRNKSQKQVCILESNIVKFIHAKVRITTKCVSGLVIFLWE